MNAVPNFKQLRIHPVSGRPYVRRGFTLTELLVVIAIIGILAAILIPVVGSVRASANSAHCVSNLRNMQLANQIYASENNGYYVSGTSFDGEASVSNPWILNQKYFDILTSINEGRDWGEWENDMLCPTTRALGSPNWNVIGSNYGISYWLLRNNLGLPGWGVADTNWGIRVDLIANPSNTVAFADCTDWLLKSLSGYSFEEEQVNDGDGPLAFRHNGVAHAVNFDASVDSYTPEDVTNPEVIKRFTLGK